MVLEGYVKGPKRLSFLDRFDVLQGGARSRLQSGVDRTRQVVMPRSKRLEFTLQRVGRIVSECI